MLVQGYQPAQDIHVVVNPMNGELSPWYEIIDGEDIITPEWHFKKNNLKTCEPAKYKNFHDMIKFNSRSDISSD